MYALSPTTAAGLSATAAASHDLCRHRVASCQRRLHKQLRQPQWRAALMLQHLRSDRRPDRSPRCLQVDGAVERRKTHGQAQSGSGPASRSGRLRPGSASGRQSESGSI